MTKDATIKLRVSAEEKANWEAQAEADATTLSSLIRRRMNHPTTRADGVLETAPMTCDFAQGHDGPCRGFPKLGCPVWDDELQAARPADAGLLAKTLETATAERRTTDCEHGRPQYVYCPTCD